MRAQLIKAKTFYHVIRKRCKNVCKGEKRNEKVELPMSFDTSPISHLYVLLLLNAALS